MTKKELDEFVLKHAAIGRESMIADHGDFRQQALIVDKRGELHWIVMADMVLHGHKMAAFLLVHSMSIGGADAILIQSDARMARNLTKAQLEEVRRRADKDQWIIADNPKYQEVFITCARSREHTAGCFQRYTRQSDNVIVFDDPEPQLMEGKQNIPMIPNVWERVN